MIIDGHCHAGRGDGFTGPWDTRASLERYAERAAAAGIGRTVLLAAFSDDYARANRAVARLVARHPERYWGFVFVHAERDRGRIARMVAEGVEEHGFCGVKVHRRDARITREICEAAQAFGLPVLYDVMGETASVPLYAGEYPGVDFIIPHLGSFADDWAAQTGMIEHLVRFPNVHSDTAGVRRFDVLEDAVRRAGAEKILFGSDGPWLHPGVELAKIHALGLPPREAALILGGNLLRLVRSAGAAHVSRLARSSWSARSVTFNRRDAT